MRIGLREVCKGMLPVALVSLGLAAGACDMMHHDKPVADKGMHMSSAAEATATIRPSAGNNVSGTVSFYQQSDGVKVVANISGLEPSSSHGFHIHEKGDLSSPDFMSAGPHWNPTGEAHGGPGDTHHHLGDMGNLKSDSNGTAHLEMILTNVSINGSVNPIVGRSVIIHEKKDDMKSQPSGDSGKRVGGGVIEVVASGK